jgi:hypothetical protein
MKPYISLKFIRPKLRTNLRGKLNDYAMIVEESTPTIISLNCAEYGIIHEVTPPYSPQSNGVAERKNQTLTDLINAMLESVEMPYEW